MATNYHMHMCHLAQHPSGADVLGTFPHTTHKLHGSGTEERPARWRSWSRKGSVDRRRHTQDV